MGRKITILGMGPSAFRRSYDIARYCDGTDIWSLNNAYLTFEDLHERKAFARMFELHSWNYLRTWTPGKLPDGAIIDHARELDRLGCEVVTAEHLPVVRRQKMYPFGAVFAHYRQCWGAAFGDAFRLYFKGSPTLMMALALYEHDTGSPIEYLQSYGIDTMDPQHQPQRAPWSWWVCAAASRGIRLGGTMLAFMDEYDQDDGLRGLDEQLVRAYGAQAKQEPAAAVTAAPPAEPETDNAIRGQ